MASQLNPKSFSFPPGFNFLFFFFYTFQISLKSLPRMEKIPSVYCPQHSPVNLDVAQGPHPDGKDLTRLNKENKYLSNGINPEPLFCNEKKDELLENNLPLKFQGVRKKTYETHERKRKKRISFYGSPSSYQLERSPGSDIDFLDGMPIDLKKMPAQNVIGVYDYYSNKKIHQSDQMMEARGESSFNDQGKMKSPIFSDDLSELMKPQNSLKLFDCNFFEQKVNPNLDLMILQNLSDKSKSDFRTKEKSDESILKRLTNPNFLKLPESKSTREKTDLLDDRMQITCAISGKHHCNSECDEENDGKLSVEKPKRRRSLSKARVNDIEEVKPSSYESEKILHGKFKELDISKTEPDNDTESLISKLEVPDKWAKISKIDSDCKKALTPLPEGDNNEIFKTPTNESLPLDDTTLTEVDSLSEFESFSESESAKSDEEKTESGDELSLSNRFLLDNDNNSDDTDDVQKEADDESDDKDFIPESSNPFLEAILRTTRRSLIDNVKGISNKCDNSQNNKLINSEIIINNSNSNNNKVDNITDDNCDPVDKNLDKSDIFLQKFKNPIKNYITEKMSDLKAKVDVSDKVQSVVAADEDDDGTVTYEEYKETPKISNRNRKNNLDLKLERKKSPAVRNLRDLGEDDIGSFAPSEFLTKSINRLKSLFDKQDLKSEVNLKKKNFFLLKFLHEKAL